MRIAFSLGRKTALFIGALVLVGAAYLAGMQGRTTGQSTLQTSSPETSSTELSSDEISTLLKSLALINCTDVNGRYSVQGTGTLINFDGQLSAGASAVRVMAPDLAHHIAVLTNAHVATLFYDKEREVERGLCMIDLPSVPGITPIYSSYPAGSGRPSWIRQYDEVNDYALLGLTLMEDADRSRIEDASISGLLPCPNMAVGDKVIILGYPAAGRYKDEGNILTNVAPIVTEGIISGVRGTRYYTTAKIDEGNSGGLAVSKKGNQRCMVGIPTWVSQGEYENLGVIQAINPIITALNG